MKDIDFDELDRAVNSLIGPRQQGAATQTEVSNNTQSVATLSPVVTEVSDSATAPAAQVSPDPVQNVVNTTTPELPAVNVQQSNVSIGSTQVQAAQKFVPVYYNARPRPLITTPINPPKPMPVNTFESLASKRSSGRFVDVVNPSANVQMSSKVELVAAPVQQTVIAAEPVLELAQSSIPTIEQQPIAQPVVAPVQNITQPASDQSQSFAANPIFEQQPAQVVAPTIAPIVVEDEDDDIDQISNFITTTMAGNNPQKAQESPFLNDSKIDKRPLNPVVAPVQTSVRPVPVSPMSISSFNSINSQLPPELQNDLLSIESDSMPETINVNPIEIPAISINTPEPQVAVVDTAAPAPIVQSQVLPTTPQANYPSPTPTNTISIAPVMAPLQTVSTQAQAAPQVLTQTSIPQQYPDRPNVVDHTTTPIYDTNAYHKLDSKNSKKSPLMWLFWMIGLIVIGAGVGVVAYFFILPNL